MYLLSYYIVAEYVNISFLLNACDIICFSDDYFLIIFYVVNFELMQAHSEHGCVAF